MVALVLLVFVSRVWQARESLWLDELHTAWTVAGTWGEVARRAADGNQSPLFFWLEWVLVRTLGVSEAVLRSPSLVAGSLLPVALFGLTRRWTGSAWLALLPAWLAAVDPQAIYFGTEARPYALIQLLAVGHIALFASTVERPTAKRRIALVVGMVLLFYLHYTAILLMAAEVAYFAVLSGLRKNTGEYGWTSLAVDSSAVGVLALAALPNVLMVYARRGNWESFVAQRPVWQAILTIPWATTAVAMIVIVTAARLRGQPGSLTQKLRELPTPSVLALCWLLVPLVIAWLASATDVARLLHPRYVATAAPAALVLVALAGHFIPWRQVRIVSVAGLAVAGLLVSRIPTEMTAHGRLVAYRTDDWRAAIAYFNRQPGHGSDPVLLRSLLIESDALGNSQDARLHDYCLYPVTALYRIDADSGRLIPLRRTNSWELSAGELRRVQDAAGFWMIAGASSTSVAEIERQFLEVLGASAGRARDGAPTWTITRRETFGTVHVLRFERLN